MLQHLAGCVREAKTRTSETDCSLAGHSREMFLGEPYLFFDFLGIVKVKPRLVRERVIADLVPARCECPECVVVLLERRILTDNEECDSKRTFREEIEDARNKDVQVGRKALPTPISMRLEIGPLVIEIQRQASCGLVRIHVQ